MKTIIHTFDIAAPRDQVFGLVQRPDGLARWWSTQVSADTLSVGGVVSFTFAGDFNPDMRIEEMEPDQLITWLCTAGHEPWQDNTFRFELSDSEGQTRLRFRQHYAIELDDDAYGIYNFNWGYYLQSLKEFAETGTGKPFDPLAT
jgi:uncharacterized protein YndB with AHSA1/START domain